MGISDSRCFTCNIIHPSTYTFHILCRDTLTNRMYPVVYEAGGGRYDAEWRIECVKVLAYLDSPVYPDMSREG